MNLEKYVDYMIVKRKKVGNDIVDFRLLELNYEIWIFGVGMENFLIFIFIKKILKNKVNVLYIGLKIKLRVYKFRF